MLSFSKYLNNHCTLVTERWGVNATSYTNDYVGRYLRAQNIYSSTDWHSIIVPQKYTRRTNYRWLTDLAVAGHEREKYARCGDFPETDLRL